MVYGQGEWDIRKDLNRSVRLADRGRYRSVSTAQGGYARGRAATLVAQLMLELVEVRFHKGLSSQDCRSVK